MALLDEITTLHEVALAARRRLSQGAFDYLRGGTETETGLARNRQAIESVALRPRVCRDVRRVDAVVRRAVDRGYEAFAITVDTAWYSRRERDLLNRFEKPWRRAAEGTEFQMAFDWGCVARFKERHRIALILKGIMTAEDAALAVEHGVDAIVVSNHGGRQLDHVQGTLAVLPEIVRAVGGRARVLVDGGFYRGTDVVKAIALGAEGVGLGRLLALGMAAAGPDGVVRALELLEEEIKIALGLLGVTRLAELGPQHLAPAPPVRRPGFWSAFPLVAEGY